MDCLCFRCFATCAVEQETDSVAWGLGSLQICQVWQRQPQLTEQQNEATERNLPFFLFCLFPTVNVFWFWKSMCDCNIFDCTTAQFVVICTEYALLNHMRLPKIPVLNIVGTDSTSQTIILFRESLDSGGRRPVWLHHRCRLCFVNANISCVGLNWMSKRWVTVPIKK